VSSRIVWLDPATRPQPPVTRRPGVAVSVWAADPLVRTGLMSEIRDKPGIRLREDHGTADVVVAVTDSAQELPELATKTRLVLVADEPRAAELWAAIEHGLIVLVPRSEATTARLLRAIADAHHRRGDVPAEQLGHLLQGLSRLHHEVLAPRDLTLSGLSRRETDVLRLLADGMDTAEIATELTYSERTVKNILHSLMSRLGVRNRTHAVAYALREGMI
jgi:DNA-binding NarL/FixJ family response regulator